MSLIAWAPTGTFAREKSNPFSLPPFPFPFLPFLCLHFFPPIFTLPFPPRREVAP